MAMRQAATSTPQSPNEIFDVPAWLDSGRVQPCLNGKEIKKKAASLEGDGLDSVPVYFTDRIVSLIQRPCHRRAIRQRPADPGRFCLR